MLVIKMNKMHKCYTHDICLNVCMSVRVYVCGVRERKPNSFQTIFSSELSFSECVIVVSEELYEFFYKLANTLKI